MLPFLLRFYLIFAGPNVLPGDFVSIWFLFFKSFPFLYEFFCPVSFCSCQYGDDDRLICIIEFRLGHTAVSRKPGKTR